MNDPSSSIVGPIIGVGIIAVAVGIFIGTLTTVSAPKKRRRKA